ncbi:unnamed protein product [Prunus brigantina]
MPWTDDDGAATNSCVLGPSVEGGMPERLVAHLKNNLVNLSAFDGGDFQDWNICPDYLSPGPMHYHALGRQTIEDLDEVILTHLPREHNSQANAMAQLASGVQISEGLPEELFKVEKQSLSSVFERGISPEVMVLTVTPDDWRHEIVSYLKALNGPHSQQVRQRARYYVIRDEILFRISFDDLLMKCLGKKEQLIAMTEVHEGICGAHQAEIKMRWLLRRHGYYWPTILKDCIEYAKGCQDCQRHGPVQHVPGEPMNPIVKAWHFKGWAMDVIGQIHPEWSKGHKYILVATNFFTKWVESVPLKKVTQAEVLVFIEKTIIYRFGLLESIMTDRGTAFMGEVVQAAARNWGVRMVQSTPYNPQSNGQAEASNKVIKGIWEKCLRIIPKNGIPSFLILYGHIGPQEGLVPERHHSHSHMVMMPFFPSRYP